MNSTQVASAVLLAGGRSSRMGRDKAMLRFRGRPLWQHGLDLLRQAGVQDLWISAPADDRFRHAPCPVVADHRVDRGPLAGLEAAWSVARHDWLLVLAVDLPHVPTALLRQLIEGALREGCGLVPARADWLQPLAAVYPRRSLPLLLEQLDHERLSVRDFCRQAEGAGMLRLRTIAESELAWFHNLNTPADLHDATS